MTDHTDTRRCTAIECDRAVYAQGLCMRHYQRRRRHGDPEVVHRAGRKPHTKQEADGDLLDDDLAALLSLEESDE